MVRASKVVRESKSCIYTCLLIIEHWKHYCTTLLDALQKTVCFHRRRCIWIVICTFLHGLVCWAKKLTFTFDKCTSTNSGLKGAGKSFSFFTNGKSNTG